MEIAVLMFSGSLACNIFPIGGSRPVRRLLRAIESINEIYLNFFSSEILIINGCMQFSFMSLKPGTKYVRDLIRHLFHSLKILNER